MIVWVLAGLLAWGCWRWVFAKRAEPVQVRPPDAPDAVPSPMAPVAMQAALADSMAIPGRRTIMVASMVVAVSMSLNWVDHLLISRTGVQLGLTLLLWLWLYPFMAAWRRWRLWPRLASVCLGLSTLSGLLIWYQVSHVKVLFLTIDMSGLGIAIYLGATLALWWGLARYARVHSA